MEYCKKARWFQLSLYIYIYIYILFGFVYQFFLQIFNLWIFWIIWKLRNGVIFKGKPFYTHQALNLLWICMHEADQMDSGTLSNSITDHLNILKFFNLSIKVNRAPRIVEVDEIFQCFNLESRLTYIFIFYRLNLIYLYIYVYYNIKVDNFISL